MKTKSSTGSWFFAVFWCGMMLFLDGVALPGVVKQIRATGFPSVNGEITQNETRVIPRAKGKPRYRWTIEYRYAVAGRELTGNRIHFGTMTFGSGREQAQRYAAEYPVGKAVTVFADPAAPEQAVLRPGLLPEHLFLALSLLPFHLIGWWLVMAARGTLSARGPGNSPPLVLQPLDELRMAVRMQWLAPWVVGGIALGAASLAAMFALLMFASMPPTFLAMAIVWVLVLAAGVRWKQRRQAQLDAGLADLVIDAGARTVTLPTGFGRKDRVTFPFTEVGGLKLNTRLVRTTRTHRGRKQQVTEEQFDLMLIGPNETAHQLANAATPDQLRAIGETLRETVGWSFSQMPA